MTGTLDFSPLAAAIRALADALDILDDAPWLNAQPERVRRTLVSGAVQSIEFVFELSIKSIQRALDNLFAIPEAADTMTYRELIRTAAESGLVQDVPTWFGYRDMRNITSHTYDEKKALAVLAQAPGFLVNARALLERLNAANG